MDVRKIVEKWLKENGYEGLYNDECGCEIGDLISCGGLEMGSIGSCKPGYKVPCDPESCPADGDCPWHIAGVKQGGDNG